MAKERDEATTRAGNKGYQNVKALKEFGDVRLTKKQRDWIREYLHTGNGLQSALKVYDTDDTANAAAIAHQNLKKLRKPIRAYMEYKGLGLEELYETLKGGLAATRFEKVAPGKYKEREDHSTREKFLKHAYEWLADDGDFEDTKEKLDKAKVVVKVFEPSLQSGAKKRRKGAVVAEIEAGEEEEEEN